MLAGLGQLRGARRDRRRPAAQRVHHRRASTPSAMPPSVICPRVTGSSGSSSSILGRCACAISAPTTSLSASPRTIPTCARSSACRSGCGMPCSATCTCATSGAQPSSPRKTRASRSHWRRPPAVAIENARLMQRTEEVAVLEDRERIARDLHDKVIQRLFATGMALQMMLPVTGRDDLDNRISDAVDELDVTIREIRSTIFALQTPVRRGLRVSIFALIDGAKKCSGSRPSCTWTGRSTRSSPSTPPSICSRSFKRRCRTSPSTPALHM